MLYLPRVPRVCGGGGGEGALFELYLPRVPCVCGGGGGGGEGALFELFRCLF